MIRWSAATDFVFYFGVLGQAAYLADPAKQVMNVWLFFLALMVPGAVLSLLLVRRRLSGPRPPLLPAA